MRILGTSRLCQLALVAVAATAIAGSDAMASSYGSWGSTGSYGSYGSYASTGSYGSYGSGGCYGSYGGGLFARMRANRDYRIARRSARRAARASYGCYGSYGSTGSYGCYGSYGSSGCSGGVIYTAPVVVDPCVDCVGSAATSGSASIAVTLPEGAKVFVNDRETTSTGSVRNYVSNGLESGKTYAYKLRVEFERDGEKVVEHKVLKLHAGDNLDVSFGSEDSPQLANETPVETELKLEVPENAVVFLSGAKTKQTGVSRSYITQRLASGEIWTGYTVRVELEQDGKKLVQERQIAITGGETYEFAFDFEAQDGMKLAQLAK